MSLTPLVPPSKKGNMHKVSNIRAQGTGLFFIILIVLVKVLGISETFAAGSKSQPSASSSRDRLIAALIQVESNGKDHAIGDRHLSEKAYGPLQIRKPCLDDVNQSTGTKYRPQDMLGNRSLSIDVCNKYLDRYATAKRLGREPTYEDMARIWNGGPTGYKRDSTLKYWSKVQKYLK